MRRLTLKQIPEEVVVALKAAHDIHRVFVQWQPTIMEDLALFRSAGVSLWHSPEEQEWYLRFRFASESAATDAWRSHVCITILKRLPGIHDAGHLPHSVSLPPDAVVRVMEEGVYGE